MPLYRRLEPNAQLLEYRCIEFVEEFMYGDLRKKPLVKRWEGETMIVDITRKVPPGDKLLRVVSRYGSGRVCCRRSNPMRHDHCCRRHGLAARSRWRDGGVALRASRVCGRVRREQAGHLQGHRHEDGMGQSACLAPHRREEAGRQGRERGPFEGGTPNVLFRRGFTKKSLLPGTEIVIDGYQAKGRQRRANGRDLTFADGRKLFLGSSGTGRPTS